MISPITKRVLGVYGHDKKKAYYQGTYEMPHEGLRPFRCHTLAIKREEAKQFDKGVSFCILNTISKSIPLSYQLFLKKSMSLQLMTSSPKVDTKDGFFGRFGRWKKFQFQSQKKRAEHQKQKEYLLAKIKDWILIRQKIQEIAYHSAGRRVR